jgi:hypothetical protein
VENSLERDMCKGVRLASGQAGSRRDRAGKSFRRAISNPLRAPAYCTRDARVHLHCFRGTNEILRFFIALTRGGCRGPAIETAQLSRSSIKWPLKGLYGLAIDCISAPWLATQYLDLTRPSSTHTGHQTRERGHVRGITMPELAKQVEKKTLRKRTAGTSEMQ